MAAIKPTDEADLDEAFEQGAEFGIRFLNSEYQERVLRYIKRCGCGFFTHEDLQDVYQETLIGMHQKARQDGFQPCRSLRLVLTIARNKSFDLLRQRGLTVSVDEDAILDLVAIDTKDSEVYSRWKLRVSPSEARELKEILLTFIATLPERQRIVAHCFINHYQAFRRRDTYKPLADAVGAITGVTESVAAVKNDWRYAREKIIAELKRRGYTELTPE